MDILYAGGVNNPMDSIEQISYLIFLRQLTEKDETLATLDKKYKRIFSGAWSRYAWGNFVTLAGDNLFNAVRDAIEKLHELPGLSDTGKLLFNRATLKIYDRPTLRAVVQGIHGLDLAAHEGHDFKGDMYEYLLSKLSASGTNGQFRTPRHIINMIVELVDPHAGQRICDPACGTAGFLISAFTHILRNNTKPADLKRGNVDGALLKPVQWRFLEEQAFTGYDNDANMVKIGILNLYLHQLEKAQIELRNTLTTGFGGAYPGKLFDIILANPPFAGKVQDESILSDLNYKLNTRATELLFLKWFIDHLAAGGRAGVIVPNGVLFGANKAATGLREFLLTECDLQAVVSLPSGVFKPYSGVGTAALILQKGSPTKSVWFYDLTGDGFSLDDKRNPIEANDIPDVIVKWPNRDESANSYRVPIEKIRENDWSLAAGRYKRVIKTTATHAAPVEALDGVLELGNEILGRGNALLEDLRGDISGSKGKAPWPVQCLGEVCTINPKFVAPDALSAETEVTFVPMAAVDEVSGTIAEPQSRSYKEVAKGYTNFRENDVLFAKITPCMENGKAAIARNLRNGLGFGSTEFHVLRPSARVLAEWVFALVRQPSFRSAAEANFTGTAGQKRVPSDFIKRFPIPVPPLKDQKRIVKLLDQASGLRISLTKIDRGLEVLLLSLVHRAFSGEL